MTDFKAAFQDGLKAAQDAELARKEINQVFKDLNKQLSEVSKGKLRIERTRLEEPKVGFLRWIGPFEPPKMYWAIVVINPKVKDSPPKELAKWSLDRAGYPCKIGWGDREEYCEDKQASIKGLVGFGNKDVFIHTSSKVSLFLATFS